MKSIQHGCIRVVIQFFLAIAVLLAPASSVSAQDAPSDPEVALSWLKSLLVEARAGLEYIEDYDQPRLVTETNQEGETWMASISESLSPDLSALDRATTLLLHEADQMRALAENAAVEDQAKYVSARKRYLEEAAGLLTKLRDRVTAVHDDTLGNAVLPESLPDWLLPGEIQLRKIAGGGRLNTKTGEFGGRLSGEVAIPKFETTLAVPNFSFDSKGNIDLTAYGQTAFPANDPDALTLAIPPRRPLTFHLGDDGNFSVAGSGRIRLPDGNQFEAYFDIDDPEYEFGLAYSGTFTLELARQITLLRPTIDPATVFEMEAIEGLGQFFGSLGKGYESFLQEAPELPSLDDLNIGVAPEFTTPETAIPLDVLDSWLVGLHNDEVRPLLNGAISDSLEPVFDLLDGIRSEINKARGVLAFDLNQVKRLRHHANRVAELTEVLKRSKEESLLGDPDAEEAGFAKAREIALDLESVAREYLLALPADASLSEVGVTMGFWIKSDTTATAVSDETYQSLPQPVRQVVVDKVEGALELEFAKYGLALDGSIIDQAKFDTISYVDLEYLIDLAAPVDSLRVALTNEVNGVPDIVDGESWVEGDANLKALSEHAFLRARPAYQRAVAEDNLAERFLNAARLVEIGANNSVFEFTSDPDDLALMSGAMNESIAVVGGWDGPPERQKLSGRLVEAALTHRKVESEQAARRAGIILEAAAGAGPRGTLPERYDFLSVQEKPFLARHYYALRAGIDAGIIDAALAGDIKLNLASFMRFYTQAQLDRFSNGANLEANLDDAYTVLLAMLDFVAIAEDMLPTDGALIGELQANWQALHIPWLGVAEAKRAHWYLRSYAAEIVDATERYGDGMSTALKDAAKVAGSEAIRGLSAVVNYLSGVVDGIGAEEFQFALPGDIQIQRAHGVVSFNRQTLAWALAFGGRLSFPEINAIFEVPNATLDSTGAFSLEMLAASDSAFGLSDDFALEFAIPGNTGVPFTGILPLPSNNFTAALNSFGGMGTLYYHKGEPDESIFSAQVTYMALYEEMMLTGHQFTVDATAATQRELFTEEIMLFNGGVGFNLTTTLNGVPTQGGASVTLGDGSTPGFGFLLRPPAAGEEVKPPELRTPADYYLTFSGAAEFEFINEPDRHIARITLNSDPMVLSTLTLPSDIFSGPGGGEPTISLLTPVCVEFDFDDPLAGISWCDVNGDSVRLAINDIGFLIPGLDGAEATDVITPADVPDPDDPMRMINVEDVPGYGVDVSAILRLSGNAFPVIEHINANLILPIPGNSSSDPNKAANITISGEDWRIDGLPGLVSIELNQTVRLLDLGGFYFDLLGGSNDIELPDGSTQTCQTTLTFTSNPDGSVLFELFGGMRAGFESDILYEEDEAGTYQSFAGTVCGSFSWDLVNAPTFALDVLLIEGLFRLGGENGIGVQGIEDGDPASIQFTGIQNIFNQSEATPFSITLDGALDIAGYATFGLENTSFVFAGNGVEFRPGAFIFEVGEDTIDLVDGFLPAYLTAARLDFLENEGLTIEELLAPTNLKLTVSGEIHLPNKEAIDGGNPGISGQVDNFSIQLLDQGNGSYLPQVSTNGFGMQIQNLDIPPLGDLTGGLYIGNLQHPEQLYFAGVVGGKINGMGAKVLLAINTTGVIGACFDINAGPSGITLPYGFQITGATGGMSFLNGFADPCDFSDYIRMQTDPADGVMKPVNDGNEDVFEETVDPNEMPEEPEVVSWEHCLVENAGGTFPLDSVNPLCMPHPTLGATRIVYKGTVLDAAALTTLGITPATPELQGTVDEAVDFASAKFREAILGSNDLVLRAFLDMLVGIDPSDSVFNYIQSILDLALDGAEDMARASLRNLLLGPVDCDTDGFIGTTNVAGGGDPSFYDIVLELAECGIPCQDVTLKVQGKISHVAVSSFLYGDVGVTLSTTGSASVQGSVNVMGIPVGEGQFVYQLTDTTGAVNPSYGGIVNVGIGPLEFGNMSFGYRCDDCYTALGAAFLTLMNTYFDTANTAANDLLVQLIDRAVPLPNPRDLNVSAAAHFALLATVEERVAVITEVFNIVNLKADDLAELQNLYGPGIEAVFVDLMAGFKTFLFDILQSVDMVMCFEADVTPKIFGFPLVPGEQGLGAQLAFNTRVEDPPGSGQFYQVLNGSATISPSQMVTSVLLGATGALIPPADTVSMGFSLRVLAFDDDTTALAIEDPVAFATQQVGTFINDAVVTFDYQLQPLGLKLANGQARAIMPRFDEHPDRSGVTWERPDAPDVATRSEVILAALNKNLLSDTSWRGGAGQLYQLFEGEDPTGCAQGIVAIRDRLTQSEMDQLDLAVDYFPYGGLIGGAELELPNFITELPPANFSQLFVIPELEDVGTWIDNATDIFNNYLTASTCVGQMALYVPAPSPGADFVLEEPQEMFDAIKAFDVNQLISRTSLNYPINELMLNGWLEVPILGMPQMRGEMDYKEDTKVFTAHLEVPPTAWVSDFLTEANLDVKIEAPPYLRAASSDVGLEAMFQPVIDAIATADRNAPLSTTVYDGFVNVMRDSLPKASFEADATINAIPPQLQPYLTNTSNLKLYGFSFAHSPDHAPGSSDPYDIAKQRGGLGVRGSFEFGFAPAGISIDVDNAGMSLTPSDGSTFPALNGTVQVDGFDPLPGIIPAFSNGELTFSSSPNNGAPWVRVAGNVEPFKFVVPNTAIDLLAFSGPGGSDLGATLEILRADGAPNDTATSVVIDPAIATMPFLGQDLAITIHGCDDPNDLTEPFTFSSVDGQEWCASMRITSSSNPLNPPSFVIRDPRTPAGPILARINPNGIVTGTINGTGLQSFNLELSVPCGGTVTLFEGQETETVLDFGDDTGDCVFFIDHLGRFFLDLGADRGINLPGIVNGSGHVVIGYNSTGPKPSLAVSTAPFDYEQIDIGQSRTREFPVQNIGLATAVVNVTTDQPGHYTVGNGTFTLDPGQTHQVAVVFHPQSLGALPATLTFASNEPDPPAGNPARTISLDGEGVGTPKYFQSLTAIDFGPTVIGETSKGTLTIGNAGTAPLTITSMSKSGSAFSISPAIGGRTFAPGEGITYQVSFSPLAIAHFDGSLTVNVAGEPPHVIELDGDGAESQWFNIRDASIAGYDSDLNDIHMDSAVRGHAVGDDGVVLQTTNGGHSWIRRDFTKFDLNAIIPARLNIGSTVAEYHFEDPGNELTYRDDSGNAYHAVTTSSGKPKRVNTSSAVEGATSAWMSFVSNDYLDLGDFAMNTGNFSLSMWVKPNSLSGSQTYIGKNSRTGDNEFIFGFFGGAPRVYLGAQNQAIPVSLTTDWQHFYLSVFSNAGANRTDVRVYRNGTFVTTLRFTGTFSIPPGGRDWSLGSEWNGSTRGAFANAGFDEVYFFEGGLTGGAIAALAAGGSRMAIVGDGGMAFQSHTKGAKWQQVPDPQAYGWFGSIDGFAPFQWHGGGFDDDGRLFLVGDGGSPTIPSALGEDVNGDLGPMNTFGGLDPGEYFTSAFNTNTRIFATSSTGRIYRATDTVGSWFRQGSNLIPGGAFAGDAWSVTEAGYVVVGAGGDILQSTSGASPGAPISTATASNLLDVTHVANTNTWHAVGDNGAYLTAPSSGTIWTVRGDGLTGNNRGVSAIGSTVWAAGEEQRISIRPGGGPAQPFLVFDPGKLDFGFLLLGEAKTLPVRISNRGRRDLETCDLFVSGTGYSTIETSIDRLAPGDSVTILVRYKPTVTSDQDLGTLSLATPEGNFKIPLTGRVSTRKWQPLAIKTGGNPVPGEVIDMEWTSATRGYALVQNGSSTSIWRTSNGGNSWFQSTLPNLGYPIRLTAIDMIGTGSSADDGYAVGWIFNTFTRSLVGVILRTLNGTSTWTSVPLPAPNNEAIYDVSMHDSVSRVVVAASTNLWESTNSGSSWTQYFTDIPQGFAPRSTEMFTRAGNPTSPYVFSAQGEKLYWKVFGTNWSFGALIFTFPAGQTVNDYTFYDDPANTTWAFDYGWIVGDNGLFWRQEAAPSPTEWTTADNAEVFATTDLESVDFHRSGSSSLGWICGESRIFRSSNDGRSWDLSFDAGEAAVMNVADAVNFNDAFVGGSFNNEAVIWAYNDTTANNTPILSVDDLVLFPGLDPGESHTATLPLQNIGAPGLQLHSAVIESADPLSRFEVVSASTSSVQVKFDATPEPEFAADLDPEVFLRFEQGRTALEYYDDTLNKFHAVPAAGNAAPRIIQEEGARDRCLQFDGNDHADITGLGDIADDFTLSLWVNPESAGGSQFFIGKHSSGGGTNFLLFGIHSGGYYMGIRSDFHTEGTPKAGWQHLVVTGKRNGTGTDITVWRDGTALWQHTLTQVVGDVTGQPWILGADRDSTRIDQHLKGCLDDVAVFNRVLTPGEIAKLGTKSPLVGEHRARLILNTNAGEARAVDLRAVVGEPGELIVFESELPGQQILIDGLPYTTPVAFVVKSTATTANEWTEGSMHTVSIPIDTTTVTNNEGDSVDYQFECWDSGTDSTQTFCAGRAMGNQRACYNIVNVDAGTTPPPPGTGANNPLTMIEALANTPQGPFLRITDAQLTVPAADDFTVDGSLFVSPSLLDGTLSTSAMSFPAGSPNPYLEVGASKWNLHLESGEYRLSAQPPSVKVMDVGVAPASGVEFVFTGNTYHLDLSLADVFAPIPGYLEFKNGSTFSVGYNGVSHSLSVNGGVRAIENPDGWVFDENIAFTLAEPGDPVTVNLRTKLDLPDPLFETGSIELGWFNTSSNATFTYGPGGFGLAFNGMTLDAFGGPLINNASAAVTTGGLFEISEAVGTITLSSDLTLTPPAGGSGLVKLSLQAGAAPTFRVETPEMELQSSKLSGGTITIPPLTFDTSGDFDTGTVALPPITLAAIGIIPRLGGDLEKNHFRLSRVDGVLKFQVRSEIVFLPGCGWHQLDLSVASNGTVSGSIAGTFCIGIPLTITYDNSDPLFQFREVSEHYEIGFGTGGAFARPR